MFDSLARPAPTARARPAAAFLLALLCFGTLGTLLSTLRAAVPIEAVELSAVAMSWPGRAPPIAAVESASSGRPKTVAARARTASSVTPPPIAEAMDTQQDAVAVVLPGDAGSSAPEGAGAGAGGGSGLGAGSGFGAGPGEGPGGGILTIHSSEAVPRLRVNPVWPRAAAALGINEARCVAHVVMDELGEPLSVTLRSCPALFESATREAAMQWRWHPLESSGAPVRAQFDIAFVFRR